MSSLFVGIGRSEKREKEGHVVMVCRGSRRSELVSWPSV